MDEVFGCLSRRDVLIASAGTASMAALEAAEPAQPANFPPTMGRVTLTVNGKPQTPDLLRETLQLTGTKKGRDHGQCGDCTPGQICSAPGMMALEVAMDEMAEKLGLDPIAFRLRNDTMVDPEKPQRPFTQRRLADCFKLGAEKFGWNKRNAKPAQQRDGRWLVGLGVASAFRNNLLMKSKARVRLEADGRAMVETDMTDIGTGSYTVIAQTAAEVLGLPLERVVARLGDSTFPASCGSGRQRGGNNACAGVYAACMKLRALVAQKAGLGEGAEFTNGDVRGRAKALPLNDVAGLVAEDGIAYGDIDKRAARRATCNRRTPASRCWLMPAPYSRTRKQPRPQPGSAWPSLTASCG